MRHLLYSLLFLAGFVSCMKYGPREEERFTASSTGLFIVNEGNFMYGNASLSYYNIETKQVENQVFVRANAFSLGDVAQSMALYDGKGYVVVNNSGVVFVIDPSTFKVTGVVDGLTSPRFIHFVSDTQAYITDLYAGGLTIFNPTTLERTGVIPTPSHLSTEEMVRFEDKVFTNCWSYDNKILIIDTQTNAVTDSIEVGYQPYGLVLDKYNKIWTCTQDGLTRIDAATAQVEAVFPFSKEVATMAMNLSSNATRDTLYFLNQDVWRMCVTDTQLPQTPFVPYRGTIYYGLSVDPHSSEVYVADAIDYMQSGVIYRYAPNGTLIDTFKAGIIPGAFCFK